MRSSSRFWGLFAISGALLVASGCSPLPLSTADSKAAIEIVSEMPLDGYVLMQISGGQNSFDYVNPEYSLWLTKRTLNRSAAEECASLFDFATPLGASHWHNDTTSGVSIPIDGHEAQARIACVQTIGSAWDDNGLPIPDAIGPIFSLWSPDSGVLGGREIPMRFSINIGEGKIFIEVSTLITINDDDRVGQWSWDEAFEIMDTGGRFLLSAFDPLGEYIAAHPNADPESWETVTAAYAESRIDAALGTVEILRYKKKVFLHLIPNGGGRLPVCASVAAFDPNYFGVDDPGFGYIVGYENGLKPKSEFASGVNEDCPPVEVTQK